MKPDEQTIEDEEMEDDDTMFIIGEEVWVIGEPGEESSGYGIPPKSQMH